jgi:hypothetical protein
MQDLDIESTAREQEPGDTAEARVTRRHEHPEGSKRTNVPDVHLRLFHGLRCGP